MFHNFFVSTDDLQQQSEHRIGRFHAISQRFEVVVRKHHAGVTIYHRDREGHKEARCYGLSPGV